MLSLMGMLLSQDNESCKALLAVLKLYDTYFVVIYNFMNTYVANTDFFPDLV